VVRRLSLSAIFAGRKQPMEILFGDLYDFFIFHY